MKQHEIARLQSLLDNGDAMLITADDIQNLIIALEEAMIVKPHITEVDIQRVYMPSMFKKGVSND